MSMLIVISVIVLRNNSDDAAIWLLIKLAGFTYGPLIGLFFFGILSSRNLIDKLVPVVCFLVPLAIGIIWYLNNSSIVNWFGDYKFGAELIIYNAVISFFVLSLISKKKII